MTWRKNPANALIVSSYIVMAAAAGSAVVVNTPALLTPKPAIVRTVERMDTFIDKTRISANSPDFDETFRKEYLDTIIASMQKQRDGIASSSQYKRAQITYEDTRDAQLRYHAPFTAACGIAFLIGGGYALANRKRKDIA